MWIIHLMISLIINLVFDKNIVTYTVVPWYSSLVCSGTHDECQNQQVLSNEEFSLTGQFCDSQFQASVTSPEQVLSAGTFLSHQNVMRSVFGGF